MTPITEQQLQDILAAGAGDPRPPLWTAPLNQGMAAGAIDTPVRQAAFLAQVLVESAQLRQLVESLEYSAPRLRQVWPRQFPTDADAQACSHAPEKLANKVYANRLGNGDEASGDGWRYRGRGLIQLTGRANYAALAAAMHIDAVGNPDMLAEPTGAVLSAVWFWQTKGLNAIADRTAGSDGDEHFTELTRRINGGINGLPERRAYWERTRQVLGVNR
ncbi:putative chitinase [Pseudoduganella flava]|uniref:Glycoside hydrolase family 19 protein n=1 Tax=Pseudoduganella flava TaxID=871742 RepID=A0A562PDM6_9BURK|nr:glycoside hydrolase family 19 protein [Pseudoduganella flava]QGZ42176.1 glycoside hydrolase family 19 protein [Pseudoduganella flava]TWI42443.1 putative chitinase [Pseudoduganella flava]